MKREERKKEENKVLKDWKKPELKVLEKGNTKSGGTPAETEATGFYSL